MKYGIYDFSTLENANVVRALVDSSATSAKRTSGVTQTLNASVSLKLSARKSVELCLVHKN